MAPPSLLLIGVGLLALASAQQIGKIPEVHPRLTTWKCTKAAGCTAQNTSVVLDTDFRAVSAVHGSGGLFCKHARSSEPLNATLCPDAETCAANCALEGIANYTAFGVRTDGAASMTMNMYVDGVPASPRVYLLAENGTHYEDIRLVNAEIAYDVDTSNMPCGMCGALYLSEMDMDGGRSDLNPAGASMGTGYCDAQCPSHVFLPYFRQTSTPAGPAAPKWICGKPTAGRPSTRRTRARSRASTAAMAMRSAASTRASAGTRGAGSTRTRRGRPTSTGWAAAGWTRGGPSRW